MSNPIEFARLVLKQWCTMDENELAEWFAKAQRDAAEDMRRRALNVIDEGDANGETLAVVGRKVSALSVIDNDGSVVR